MKFKIQYQVSLLLLNCMSLEIFKIEYLRFFRKINQLINIRKLITYRWTKSSQNTIK